MRQRRSPRPERGSVGSLSLGREAVRRSHRAERATRVCTLRPPHLRPRQAVGAVGASGRRREADPDLPGLPARSPGLGRRPGPVRIVREHAPLAPTRRRGVPGMRPHGTRTSGRLAQLEERRPYKAKVAGSSPAAPTRIATGIAQRCRGDARSTTRRLCAGGNMERRPYRCQGSLRPSHCAGRTPHVPVQRKASSARS